MRTPREVYEELRKEGYRVNYTRVPITDGASPSIALFDVFTQAVQAASQEDPMIFNCQMGGGRTTTGMVMACLIRAKLYGRSQTESCHLLFHVPCLLHQRSERWCLHLLACSFRMSLGKPWLLSTVLPC